MIRRALWTAEYPGALDRPGGHPEPSHIFLADGSLKPAYAALHKAEAVLQEVGVAELLWLGLSLLKVGVTTSQSSCKQYYTHIFIYSLV